MRLSLALLLAGSAYPLVLDDWRMQTGDDPRWAQPEFDDRDWKPGSFPGQPESVVWFRTRPRLPAAWSGQPLALGLGPLQGAYRVWVNGKEAGHVDEGRFIIRRHVAMALPLAGDWPPLIAIRFVPSNAVLPGGVMNGQSNPHPPVVGLASTVGPTEELHRAQGILGALPVTVLWAFVLVCGLICLVRNYQSPGEPELLWIGLALACNGGQRFLTWPVESGLLALDRTPAFLIVWGPFVAVHFFYLWFAAELVPPARRWLRWAAWPIGLAFLVASASRFFDLGGGEPLVQRTFDAVAWCGLAAGLVVAGYNAWRKSVPLALAGVAQSTRSWAFLSAWIGLGTALANSLVAVTLVTILVARSLNRAARARESERDLEAARQVQNALLGGEPPRHPLFAVETAYLPARQVGGDFYFFSPSVEDGSLLVVVGDASGKGLQAALVVSTVLGALGNEDSRQPGEVLSRLNRALARRAGGGFVTCCCAHLGNDGTVTLANAGHLAPYVDGSEAEVDAGLPLGVVPEVTYGETRTTGTRLTFLSDGVLEAANAKGELFGFERTRAIATQSAQAIADAAKQWGQNDDITVVTVRSAEKEATAA